jgi:hypothetical protein
MTEARDLTLGLIGAWDATGAEPDWAAFVRGLSVPADLDAMRRALSGAGRLTAPAIAAIRDRQDALQRGRG